jgi:hypothetical protein
MAHKSVVKETAERTRNIVPRMGQTKGTFGEIAERNVCDDEITRAVGQKSPKGL